MEVLISIFFLGFTFWSFWIVWSINSMRQSLSQLASNSLQQVSLLRKSVEGETIRSPSEMLKDHQVSPRAPKYNRTDQLATTDNVRASAYDNASAQDLLAERAKLLGSTGEQN